VAAIITHHQADPNNVKEGNNAAVVLVGDLGPYRCDVYSI